MQNSSDRWYVIVELELHQIQALDLTQHNKYSWFLVGFSWLLKGWHRVLSVILIVFGEINVPNNMFCGMGLYFWWRKIGICCWLFSGEGNNHLMYTLFIWTLVFFLYSKILMFWLVVHYKEDLILTFFFFFIK